MPAVRWDEKAILWVVPTLIALSAVLWTIGNDLNDGAAGELHPGQKAALYCLLAAALIVAIRWIVYPTLIRLSEWSARTIVAARAWRGDSAAERRAPRWRLFRRGPNEPFGGVEILSARYTDENDNGVDVTEHVRARLNHGYLDMWAKTDELGKFDPSGGVPKHLKVQYRLHGVEDTKRFEEGDRVVIPSDNRPGQFAIEGS